MLNKLLSSKMIAIMRLALSRLETLPVPKPSELKELKPARGAKPQADFPSGGGMLEAPAGYWDLAGACSVLPGRRKLGRVQSDLRF